MRFVWASEETGFRHLYLITAQVSGLSNGVEETLERMESEELYSSLLSSTLQFVRSKIMFQIHLLTNTFSQHVACGFLDHFDWEINVKQLFGASNCLENKTVTIMEIILMLTASMTSQYVACILIFIKVLQGKIRHIFTPTSYQMIRVIWIIFKYEMNCI